MMETSLCGTHQDEIDALRKELEHLNREVFRLKNVCAEKTAVLMRIVRLVEDDWGLDLHELIRASQAE